MDIKSLLEIIKTINYKDWQVISKLIENEYKKIANKNVLEDTEILYKNIIQEINCN